MRTHSYLCMSGGSDTTSDSIFTNNAQDEVLVVCIESLSLAVQKEEHYFVFMLETPSESLMCFMCGVIMM